MQQFRHILIIAHCLALVGCQSNQEVEDRLTAAFEDTMFDAGSAGHSQGEMFSKSGYLAKWESPVRVAVTEGATPANLLAARLALDELAALSGLEIIWAKPGTSRVNLEIRFSDDRDFVINGNQRAACFAQVASAEGGVIGAAAVHVGRIDAESWRTECLTHELLHALGWRGHTHRVRSAISYAHGETDLTRWDRMMMRALYDPRLPPGILKEDAIPVVRVILREIIEE